LLTQISDKDNKMVKLEISRKLQRLDRLRTSLEIKK